MNRRSIPSALSLIACLSLFLVTGCVTGVRSEAAPPQLLLGNPDGATAVATNKEHYLMTRPQYVLSFNDTLHFPNWVAWHLEKKDIGNQPRGQFQPDSALPNGFTRITPGDYTRSGYDRGHNCPSKDRSATKRDNDAVFLMTNMTPQAHGMNAGPWEQFESYCRDLTSDGTELFIYCGHGFSSKTHNTIGADKIAVPDFGWKIAVVLPPGSGDPLRRITSSTRVIAVRMPNINTISRKDWREYRTSVQDIEQATGLKFFTSLSPAIANDLKDKVDFDRSAPSKMPKGMTPGTPKPKIDTTSDTPPANTTGQVWVNTKSGAYWRPGTQYYGKTKQGKYMSEADAIKAGYHAAGGQ